MVKTKELIICIISVIALILTITTNVFATDSAYDDLMNAFNQQNNNTNNNNNNNNGFSQIPSTTKPNNNLNNTNNNLNNTNNTTNTMPNTGVSYSSLVIIAIAGVSAVYAFKKVKEYNV